jgi:DNA-binding transcriptional MocR family regulator
MDWIPDYKNRPGRLYVAIADAIADDINRGRLVAGDRLPTHRELAWRIKVSVSTISKAFALSERRRHIAGEVGRGTFVTARPQDLSRAEPNRPQSDLLDLSFNCPVVLPDQERGVARALDQIRQSSRLATLVPYHRQWVGLPEHRRAAAKWLADLGMVGESDNIVVTNGAQQATAAILAALTEPGDIIALEELTDPGIKFLAANRRLISKALPIDQHGLIPDALEASCRMHGVRFLACMPEHQCPTLAVMPIERRKAIAEIAKRFGVTIIENGVYAPFVQRPLPALSTFAPQHCFYVTSLSKIAIAGLRIGFVMAPPNRAKELISGLAATTWMASLIPAEIASILIEDGTMARLAQQQREEMRVRQSLAAEILDSDQYASLPCALFIWLRLRENWRAESFVSVLRARGVAVTPAESFTVGHGPSPHAVRLSLGGATASRSELRHGLQVIAEVMQENLPAASFLLV